MAEQVQIRTLRVAADMDVSRYEAGAAKIAASGKNAAQANAELVRSFTTLDRSITLQEKGFTALERQFVDGVKGSRDFAARLERLSGVIERNGYDANRVSAILDGLHKRYGLVADSSVFAARGQREFAAALDASSARYIKASAEMGKLHAANQNIGVGSQFRRQNLMYQTFDVGQSLAGGINPAMVLAQQGPQVLQMYAGAGGGLKAALGDIGALAASAARVLAPAGLAVGSLAAAVNEMKNQIEAASGQTYEFSRVASTAFNVISEDIKGLISPAITEVAPVFFGVMSDISTAAVDVAEVIINAFQAAFADVKFALEAFPNVIGAAVIGSVNAISNAVASLIQKVAAQLDAFTSKANEWLPEGYQMGRFGDLGLGFTIPNTYADNLEDIGKRRDAEIKRLMGDGDVLQGAHPIRDYFKSVRDRTQVDLSYPELPETGPIPGKDPRRSLDMPDDEEKAANAYRDLVKSANDRIEQMKLEARTAGETGIAAQKLAFELDLLQKAQDKGRKITADQRKEIEGLATAFEQAATASAKVKMNADLKWQREQFYRTPQEQKIAESQRAAGLPVDMNSSEADQIRSLAAQQTMKTDLTGFFDNFRANLIANGGKFGESFTEAFRNAALKKLSDIGDQAMDKIINWLVSAFTGSNANGGGVGGIVGQSLGWLGTNSGTGASSLNNAIGFTGATTTLASILGFGGGSSSSGQSSAAAAGSMSLYREAIASIESKGSGGYAALGPLTKSGDRAYGRYQIMGNNIGPWSKEALGRSVSASEFMSSPSIQDSVFDYKFGSYVNKYGATGASKAWFGGPGAVSGSGNATDVLGTSVTGYAGKFNSAMSSMTDATTKATKGLTSFGSDLAGMGKSVISGSGSAAGGAFSNLFSANFKANTTLGDVIGYTGGKSSGGGGGFLSGIGNLLGGVFKLFGFADGTESSPGGVAMVGERGRELVNLPRGSQVIPNHKTESMLAAANNNRGGGKSGGAGVLQVVIQGASGDNHIRALVQQGVDSALSAQRVADRRGGTGAMYDRWQTQKG